MADNSFTNGSTTKDATERELLLCILDTLGEMDSRLSTMEQSTKDLVDFTSGMAGAINAAKSGKGMGAMFANMLPGLPTFTTKD